MGISPDETKGWDGIAVLGEPIGRAISIAYRKRQVRQSP